MKMVPGGGQRTDSGSSQFPLHTHLSSIRQILFLKNKEIKQQRSGAGRSSDDLTCGVSRA